MKNNKIINIRGNKMNEIKEIKKENKTDNKILSTLKIIFDNILNTMDFKIIDSFGKDFTFEYIGNKENFDTMITRLSNYAKSNRLDFTMHKIVNDDNVYYIENTHIGQILNFLKSNKIKKATNTTFFDEIYKILKYSYCSYVGDGKINGYKLYAIDLPYYLKDEQQQNFLNRLQNIFNMYYNNVSFMFSRKDYAPEIKTVWLAIKTSNEQKIKKQK